MTSTEADTPSGPVAALLVATAPDAAPDTAAQTADLLWRPVLGHPLIAQPLRALAACESITSVTIRAQVGRNAECRDLLAAQATGSGPTLSAVCRGERNWLSLLEKCGRIRDGWLVVVDATLPLLTTASLRAGLLAAQRTGVAIAAEQVKETLKRVEHQAVAETLPRERLCRLCPPIIFSREAIWRTLELYDPQGKVDAHDLFALIGLAGVPLATFDVDYPCVRVTSERDLTIIEALLRQRESERSSI